MTTYNIILNETKIPSFYEDAIKEYKKTDPDVTALENILAYRVKLDSFPKNVTL